MNNISNFQNLVLAEKRQYLRGEQEQTCLNIFSMLDIMGLKSSCFVDDGEISQN